MNKYILIFSILISSKLVAQFNPADNNVSQKYYEVMDNISKFYVDSANGKSLTETAIVALLEKLDPHSTYIPAEELQEAQSTINGNFARVIVKSICFFSFFLRIPTLTFVPKSPINFERTSLFFKPTPATFKPATETI